MSAAKAKKKPRAKPKSRSGTAWTEAQRQEQGYFQAKFRISLEAKAKLEELADEGACSMSEVVDSLILLEWARDHRRKLTTASERIAADVARDESAQPAPRSTE